MLENFNTCALNQNQMSEKNYSIGYSCYQWQKIAVNYFDTMKGKYLAIVDNYSRYLNITSVSTMTVDEFKKKMKACFAQYGILEIVSDSSSQLTSLDWQTDLQLILD